MAKPLDLEQVEALIAKNQALAARERERMNELKEQNADMLQEICTSLTVPASAFGMSYARAYLGEKASIGGISIDAGVGLIVKIVAACFGLSESKGGQRVGKFFHDVASGALASWTAALGMRFGAKKRLETPVHLPAPQPHVSGVGLAQETPKRAPGPMTFEELATITRARQETPAAAAPPPNAGAVGLAQQTPTPTSSSTIFENIAAKTAAMLTPRANQQRPQTAAQAPQPATKAAPPPAPPTAPQPMPAAQRTPPATPPKPFRFTQSRNASSNDLRAAFTCGTYPMREVDKDRLWLSQRFSLDNLSATTNWAPQLRSDERVAGVRVE